MNNSDFPQGFLVSGSGDSTVSKNITYISMNQLVLCFSSYKRGQVAVPSLYGTFSFCFQVCLWNVTSGSLLCTHEVGREVGQYAQAIIFAFLSE